MKAPGECEPAVVVPGRRKREADDVHFGERRVEDVVAARQQRLVGNRRLGRLRRPELALVRLVPDHHVPDGRKPGERVPDVRAVLVACGWGLRRLLRVGVAVHGQDDSHPRRVTNSVLEVGDVAVRHSNPTRRPLEREPERLRAEVARRRDRVGADRPGQVLAEPDDESGPVERRPRRGGTEKQRPRRGDDSHPSQHQPAPTHHYSWADCKSV